MNAEISTSLTTPEQLLGFLDDPESARRWLSGLGVRDPDRGVRDLCDLARQGLPTALLANLLGQFHALLPSCPDPGMALTNVERFIAAGGDATVLALDPRTTDVLVQLGGTSQYFSDLLVRDPSLLIWLRAGAARRDRETLINDLWADLQAAHGDEAQRLALRRFRHREMLRIGYNDIIRGLPLEVVTLDLSHLADACVEAAYRLARSHAVARHGEPNGPDRRPARFVVLGLGKLGGDELNYSSDIDLIFIYDDDGQTNGPRPTTNAEFFARLGGEVVRLLSDHTALGRAYRVDMRLRPEGDQSPLARSLPSTLAYYETAGRTWERQALIKCRPVAGDLDLGRQFLDAITPFVHRRYLGATEIGEIKAMKRRIEARTRSSGADAFEVKTGRGGIRDVEFVVQFLQLLHGGADPEVRHPNTLAAIARLEKIGCLTAEERAIMDDTYRFLRRLEHRLQTLFDRQTHELPRDPESQRTLAIRMGYPPASRWEDRIGPASRFLADYRAKTELNRKILNHLLHDAFRDDSGADVDPIVDLVFDPNPGPEQVAAALGRYPFRDRETARRNVLALAREEIEFLSQARCRHFFAAIAPRLLLAIGQTADPDLTLTNLEKVSASLGAKAILWELFHFNPPTLRLYVEICATSPFLTEILINNPGMIDDLMDSLVVDRPQPGSAIKAELAELCQGAEDLAPILAGFRNKEWVRIGARDILRREPIRDVTRELADVAEAIVAQVARDQWRRRVERSGTPRRDDGRRARWAIVGLGKFGGRELNYHSDLDLMFVYDAEGATRGAADPVSNGQFFSELAQRVIRALDGLYEVDTRLRPHGASGPLAVSLDALRTYFLGPGAPWERIALTRARVVYARGEFGREVSEAIRDLLTVRVDPASHARELVAMRRRLEGSRPGHDLKRGAGGQFDLEFAARHLQLCLASRLPDVLRPNLWDALDALRRPGLLDAKIHARLREAYDFLRMVESRLRLVHNRAGVDLPDDPEGVARLAHRLGYESADAFRTDLSRHSDCARSWFHAIVEGPAERSVTP